MLKLPDNFHMLPQAYAFMNAPRPKWAKAHDILACIDGTGWGKVLIFPFRKQERADE